MSFITVALIAAVALCLVVSSLVIFIAAIGLTLAAVYAHSKIKYWQGKTESAIASQVDLGNRLLLSEAGKQRIDRDFEHLRATVNELLQRPVIAQLNDNQAAAMVQTIAQLVAEQRPLPQEKMN